MTLLTAGMMHRGEHGSEYEDWHATDRVVWRDAWCEGWLSTQVGGEDDVEGRTGLCGDARDIGRAWRSMVHDQLRWGLHLGPCKGARHLFEGLIISI